MRKTNLKPQAMVMLPFEFANDILLACEIAEIYFNISFESSSEKPEEYSKVNMDSMKKDFDRVKLLEKKFINLMKEIYN